jgi:predicted branched-subunit amino acid permease
VLQHGRSPHIRNWWALGGGGGQPLGVGVARLIRPDWKAGAHSVAPMLVGVVPFGLVAGASPVAEGLVAGAAIGFSTIVFAGASQLAAIDLLDTGASVALAVATAWLINLRMVMYSASLAPHLSH